MKLNEIFLSIDGEGIRAGELAVFVRLTGCNLRCDYCDTKYAFTEGSEATVEEIIQRVKQFGVKNVTLTGGEPLIHKDVDKLIDGLLDAGMEVNIETNGSVDPEPFMKPGTIITMDYKTGSSGESEKMNLNYTRKLREGDVLKFVMSESDFEEVAEVIHCTQPKCYVYLSPVFGKCDPADIVETMKGMNKRGTIDVSKTRVQLQMHKFIWDPMKRGV